ncbi:histidine kinase hhk13p [Diplodia corticola]|uniref:Histidine kinase hhk13p n=1 Tax=Diplodia corticola TaxID=236234 RepID=A0A1J9RAH7_9PEZI|nr:histidine kinase hhk13p [Diplodia corticola]OJD37473.1 histidine kinase hhk13p [Diplodia corticola]
MSQQRGATPLPDSDTSPPPSQPAAADDAESSTSHPTTTAAAPAIPHPLSRPPSPISMALITADEAKVQARNDQLVLVAEDNKVLQMLLNKILGRAGYKVRMVPNGQECLDYLRRTALWCCDAKEEREREQAVAVAVRGKAGESSAGGGETAGGKEGGEAVEEPSPAVILMDLCMPVMGGAEATRMIREWEREGRLARRVPIISMSAAPSTLHVQKNPADDTLWKPPKRRETVQMLDEWIEEYENGSRNGVDVGKFATLSIRVHSA